MFLLSNSLSRSLLCLLLSLPLTLLSYFCSLAHHIKHILSHSNKPAISLSLSLWYTFTHICSLFDTKAHTLSLPRAHTRAHISPSLILCEEILGCYFWSSVELCWAPEEDRSRPSVAVSRRNERMWKVIFWLKNNKSAEKCELIFLMQLKLRNLFDNDEENFSCYVFNLFVGHLQQPRGRRRGRGWGHGGHRHKPQQVSNKDKQLTPPSAPHDELDHVWPLNTKCLLNSVAFTTRFNVMCFWHPMPHILSFIS